jgi:ceramide glucosyltransferase
MFSTDVAIFLSLSAAALLMYVIGHWATYRMLARPRPTTAPDQLPPITLLKPVKGLEESLEANLRSYFELRYPAPLQYVFASTERDDPGIALARRLAAEYPERDVRFVLSPNDYGLNPKVSNLSGAIAVAKYDLLLQSDANTRVEPDYLTSVAGEFVATGASLLGSLVVGVGEDSVGAALENIQLTTFTAPGCCSAQELANISVVLGKAMLFKKSELAEVGGLDAVKDVLAEDYVLGRLFETSGRRVVLSTEPIQNVNVHTPVTRFLDRHSRWLKMRAVVSVSGFVADVGSNPTVFALLAMILGGFDPRLVGVFMAVSGYKLFGDARMLERMRGTPMKLSYSLLAPARDVLLAGVWLHAMFSRSIEWRGEHFLLTRGSVLIRNEGPLPLRLLRRVGFR